MNMPIKEFGFLSQCWAGFFAAQKNEESNFFTEWLHYCQVPGLIDYSLPVNSPSRTDLFYYDNRHDQSIFSLLVWKYGSYIIPISQENELNCFKRSRPLSYKIQKFKNSKITQVSSIF